MMHAIAISGTYPVGFYADFASQQLDTGVADKANGDTIGNGVGERHHHRSDHADHSPAGCLLGYISTKGIL